MASWRLHRILLILSMALASAFLIRLDSLIVDVMTRTCGTSNQKSGEHYIVEDKQNIGYWPNIFHRSQNLKLSNEVSEFEDVPTYLKMK